jgi:hypothetical protein
MPCRRLLLWDEAGVRIHGDQTVAPDDQRASGDELQRALPAECDRQRGGDGVAVRGEERID